MIRFCIEPAPPKPRPKGLPETILRDMKKYGISDADADGIFNDA